MLERPEVDLNLMRASSLYGDRDKCAQMQELILTTAETVQGQRRIFMGRDEAF